MSEPAVVPPTDRFDARLDGLSDRISPLVVKEVRQFVRGRDFLASFVIDGFVVSSLDMAVYSCSGALACACPR